MNVLFIGGPSEAIPAMGQAYALGYRVFVTDGDEKAPGLRWAERWGGGARVADTYSWEQTVLQAKDWQLDGVISVACDVGATVSMVAEFFDLPHIPAGVTMLGWDKRNLKQTLKARGIPVPGYTETTEYFISKPTKYGRGAVGVYRWHKSTRVLDVPGRYDDDIEIILEDWIEGPQVSTESIVYKGRVVFTGLTDRDYSRLDDFAPNVIEVGGWGPSQFEGTGQGDDIKELIAQTVKALNIENGTIKGDVVLGPKGPVLIECAIGRLSGGLSCSHYIPIAYQVDFIGAALALACGRDPRKYLYPMRRKKKVRGFYPNIISGAAKHKDRGKLKLKITK